jgi:hypothetical protein
MVSTSPAGGQHASVSLAAAASPSAAAWGVTTCPTPWCFAAAQQLRPWCSVSDVTHRPPTSPLSARATSTAVLIVREVGLAYTTAAAAVVQAW